jgi:hypothetical protein
MSPEERSPAKNGIWMCRDHGKAIDSTDPEFTVERLREWKKQAENESWRRVLRHEVAPTQADATNPQLAERIHAAADADLKVFRQTAKWPATSVALRLEVDGFDEPVTTGALARAVTSLDDLILVAPPGMGKTTTLFQIAEALLADGNGMPLVVPLGDWATDGATILDSILNRPAFRTIAEDDFRKAAAQPGVVLLLDGWNELDAEARASAGRGPQGRTARTRPYRLDPQASARHSFRRNARRSLAAQRRAADADCPRNARRRRREDR